MKTQLQPYPMYKPSDIPAVGRIPSHWQVKRLGQIGTFSKGVGGNKDDEVPEGLPCVRYGDIYTTHQYHVRQTRSYIIPGRASEYAPIRYGDVLFAGSGETIEEIGKSVANLMDQEAYCGGDVILFRPSIPINTMFIGYALDCGPATVQKATMGRGITIMHIYSSQLKYMTVPLPPVEEQAAIAQYLDHADEIINRYISAKEQLIALLEEERQAVIHQAVTRGLDPNVRLKPSGVEWLGEVPAHWQMSRVKNEFDSLNHRRIPLSAVERGAMVVRQYDYYGASGIIDKVDSYLFDDDLLLIAEDGANLVLRNLPLAVIARGKFWVNNHAHILKPRRGNLEFLAGLMEGINYSPWISGAAQPKLTQDRLMSIAIAVPSKLEQDEIIQYVRAKTHPQRAAIARARRQIELMQEYRTRLIADVVTGQVDVREATVGVR